MSTNTEESALAAAVYSPALLARAQKGDPQSEYLLGISYFTGRGVSQDRSQASIWISKAAAHGRADAQTYLGTLCEETGDFTEALKWYRLAAIQGHALAQFSVGQMHISGEGVPRDCAEALKWFHMAADQGLPSAQWNLGLAYSRGDGTPMDKAEAVKWWRLAADNGHASAQFSLAGSYLLVKACRKTKRKL